MKFNISSNSKLERFDFDSNLNNVNKIIYTDKMFGNSSLFALSKVNNNDNILSLNKNINNIEQRGSIFKNKIYFKKRNHNINSFKVNIFEYYIYRNCFRIYYKK